MPISLAFILGIVQGLTEFLPVSSSGHLVVFQQVLQPILGAIEAPLTFDVFVHLATLLVMLGFLRREILCILQNLLATGAQGQRARELTGLVTLATVPAVVFVLPLKGLIEQGFKSVLLAACGFVLTSLVLEFAHRKQLRVGSAKFTESDVLAWRFPTWQEALLIGMAQSVAVIPGVSRSGSTIAVAILLGLPAESALRFSFFMFIPAVLGASILELDTLFELNRDALLSFGLGFVMTLVAGYFALQLLVRLVHGSKLRYFAAYTFSLSMLLFLSRFVGKV